MRLMLGLIVAVLAGPALACPAIDAPNMNKAYVDAFAKMAEKVGAPCLANYNEKNPLETLIEYRPEEEDASDWKTMLTVNLFYIGDKDMTTEVNETTAAFVKRVEEAGGKVTPQRTSANDMGPMYLMRYTIGEDDKRENAAAILRAVGPDKIALVHWQKRGSDFDDAAIKQFADMNGISEESEKAKETAKPEKKGRGKKGKKDKASKTPIAVQPEKKLTDGEEKAPVAPDAVQTPAPAAESAPTNTDDSASSSGVLTGEEKPKAKFNFKTKSSTTPSGNIAP